MAASDPQSPRIPLREAAALAVGDVMVPTPKTFPADVLVGEVRRAFEQPSVRTVILVENGVFRGAIERGALPPEGPEDEPAARYAEMQPLSATPTMPMAEAIPLLERCREPRLIVLDEDGATLRGLLCFNRASQGFCLR